jgi:TRAP-type mannitol/chloroaromatic compound transport system permease large subunit
MKNKIFGLVMVVAILGGVIAGCSAPAEDAAKTTAGADAPKAADEKKAGE